jgi:hypothetical protein
MYIIVRITSAWVLDSTQSVRLSEFLKLLLIAYRETGPPDAPEGLTTELQTLWGEQVAIGQDGFLNGFLVPRWRSVVDGYTGRISVTTWLSRLSIKVHELCGVIWGTRNALSSQSDGGRLECARQAVMAEVERGSEGIQRVEELLGDVTRPTDNSNLEYIQMWLASVQVARAAQQPQEDRERRGRQILFEWLHNGRTRCGP